jgi:lycopene cyclase domain-containing protein
VRQLAYLGVLAFCLLGSGWLEFVLRTRVLARWRRLLLVLACIVPIFVIWDLYAISRAHWDFDPDRTTGILLGQLPLEELLFFVVVPFASILTIEAVRSVHPHWLAGDEPEERS